MPALFVRKLAKPLSRPLAKIWRTSLDSGIIPGVFLKGTISPIFKGGDKSDPKNYRPVTVTSVISRAFEKIIRRELVSYLEERNLSNEGQHGFRAGHSCLTQLLEHYDNILRNLAEGNRVDVLYLDFAKCFDKIDIGILMHKLHMLGIGGKIGVWLHSFLTKRTMLVKVGDNSSTEREVKSGLPQGTCLGPLLMTIMNIDIDKEVKNTSVGSFADDWKATGAYRNKQEHENYMRDIETIYEWAHKNNMTFNDKKFVLLRYGLENQVEEDDYKYEVVGPTGQIIQASQSARDLGVQMNCDTTFTEHIEKTVSSCRTVIGMILRSFHTREELPMMTLYRALVLSKLDYCSPLYFPRQIGGMRAIEKVQADFTRRITSMKKPEESRPFDYWERLKKLRLYSVERRVERYSAIFIWKVKNNVTRNPGFEFVDTGRRGTMVKISIKKNESARENSFLVWGAKVFNALPRELRDFHSDARDQPTAFKTALDSFLQCVPDEPNLTPLYSSRMACVDQNGRKTNSLIYTIPRMLNL